MCYTIHLEQYNSTDTQTQKVGGKVWGYKRSTVLLRCARENSMYENANGQSDSQAFNFFTRLPVWNLQREYNYYLNYYNEVEAPWLIY